MADGVRQSLIRRFWAALSWRGLIFFGFGPALVLLTLWGAFAPVDRLLGDLNYSLWSRPAAGDLVLVEIDSKSLQKLNSWPWSRAYHAALVQRLSQAGAAQIAFDVDFSAQSAPSADAAFAAAIAQSQAPVVLAAFAQPSGGRYEVNVPLPALRAQAQIASVNMIADEDSKLRHYRLIEDRLPDHPKSLAAILAGSTAVGPNDFLIDYGIAPRSIPRLSYVDVLMGRFDAAAVAGKKVLVGATAFELGDRFAVPRYGMLAGVEVQALAYYSVAGGRAIWPAEVGWVLIGLGALMIAGVWLVIRGLRWPRLAAGLAALSVLGLGIVLQIVFAIALPVAPWLAAIAGWSLITLIQTARRHASAALLHRAAAARQKALMEGVFNDSSDGILIVGDEGSILIANGAAGRMLETAKSTLVGQKLDAVLGGLTLARQTAEITVETASGRQLGLAVSVSRSQSGTGNGDDQGVWIVTFRDESARRGLEAARDATLRELQTATAAKNEFLARVSHELRTPLSAIIGFSTMIGDQSLGPVGNPKYIEYAHDIHSGGRRLLELVNDIIDVTRIEAEQYAIRPDVVEVASLLGACCFAVREAEDCGEKQLRFEVQPGAEAIHSDRQALAKVIAKLLSNAVKFTGPQGNIVLRAKPAADKAIVFEVADDGIGIAPAALKSVTAAFSQVRGGLDRRHEGAGLGLYFANRLMHLMGGRLEIESAPGAGTTVRLHIPGALIETSQAA